MLTNIIRATKIVTCNYLLQVWPLRVHIFSWIHSPCPDRWLHSLQSLWSYTQWPAWDQWLVVTPLDSDWSLDLSQHSRRRYTEERSKSHPFLWIVVSPTPHSMNEVQLKSISCFDKHSVVLWLCNYNKSQSSLQYKKVLHHQLPDGSLCPIL